MICLGSIVRVAAVLVIQGRSAGDILRDNWGTTLLSNAI